MYNFSLMCFTLILLFIGFPTITKSQDLVKVDSLKISLLNSVDHKNKFIILNELFKQYNQVDYKVALDYATQFDVLAREIGDSLKIVEGGRKMAYSLMDIGKNEEAIDILIRILGVAERNTSQFPEIKKQIKFILNNAGIAYTNLGNYDKALEYHFKSLLIREGEGDKRSVATALNNLGSVYYDLKDSKLAIEYLQIAVNIKMEIDDLDDLDRILINIGLCYNQLGDFERGVSYFNEGFNVCGANCADNIKREGLLGLGVAYLGENVLDKAEDCFAKSLLISKAQANTLYQVYNLHQLSSVESTKGNMSKAIGLLEEAKVLAEAFNFVSPLIQIYDQFSKFYSQKSDYEKTAFYLGKYKQLKDSIYSDELIKNLAKVQTNFAERENIKTIKEKDLILELRQQLIDRQFTQIFFVVAVTLLSLGMVLLLLVTNRKQKQASAIIAMARNKIEEQNKQLGDQNKELDKKVKERTVELSESNRQLTDVNTELDNFLYKASHDLRGPLASLQGLVNLAYMEPKDESQQLRLLGDLTSQLEKMSKMLSRLSLVSEVNHTSLESQKIDLKKALSALFEFEKKTYQSSNVQLSFTIQGEVELVSDKLLFETIIENLVTNGIKFCNSNNRAQRFVHVEISKAGSMVCLRVSDNGLGIASKPDQDVFRMFMRGSERSETGGVGLYLTKICVNRLGGNVQLEKTSGDGSTFLVQLPSDLTPILEERKRFQEAVKRKEREALEDAKKLTSAT